MEIKIQQNNEECKIKDRLIVLVGIENADLFYFLNPDQPERNTSEKIEEIIPLMELVVRPNQARATQSSYCNEAKHMSKLMKIEQLYFLSEEKCFQLLIQRNIRRLFIYLEEDITFYRNDERNEFENEDIVLVDESHYFLYVSIRKHDEND